jgi:hypothetical protein
MQKNIKMRSVLKIKMLTKTSFSFFEMPPNSGRKNMCIVPFNFTKKRE